MTQSELLSIVNSFAIEGKALEVTPLGNGLINTTYKVTTDQPISYVLQHVNTAIFPDPDMLMHNIVAVTDHIRAKLKADGVSDVNRRCLKFVPALNGNYYVLHNGECWRIMEFISDSQSRSGVSPESARIVGETFGNFQAMLADLPTQLGETIKDFHNMEFRLKQIRESVAADAAGRVSEVKWLLDKIEANADEMCKAERLYREGKLPKRICHCDTKVDNILFDRDGNVLCVIDLDTVMPNFVFSDIGDFLRTAANTAAEDEPDTDKISFNMDIFRPFAEGYIKAAKSFLTPVEIENIPFAACLFPFMQCVRFLTDYLNGDHYYHINYPEHNLVRSKAQMRMFESAKEHLPEMRTFIAQQL